MIDASRPGQGAAGIIAKRFEPTALPDEIVRIVGEGRAS